MEKYLKSRKSSVDGSKDLSLLTKQDCTLIKDLINSIQCLFRQNQ